MTPQELQASLEAIIYAADEPATLDQIAKALAVEKAEARAGLDLLVATYQTDDRGIEVRKVAGGWKFYTKAQHHDVVRKFIKSLQPPLRLTMPGGTLEIPADALVRVIQLAGSTDNPAAYAQRVVERLFPTTLPYVLDSAASFGFAGFNGRAMTDNVENVMLSLQTNTPIDQGAAVDRTNILGEFPYFAAPHADPIVD